MNSLSNSERETHLSMVADDRSYWEVFSDDPIMIAQMERIDAEFIRDAGCGRFFRLRTDQVLLRKGKRQISEETHRVLVERMKSFSSAGRKRSNENK